MRNSLVDKILKEIPLETRVKNTIETFFISEYGGTLLMPLDDNGEPLQDAVDANNKCFELAKPLIDYILNDINTWKNDGCP